MTETDAAALKAMQDDIYRERVRIARKMTPEQRLAAAFEQSNFQFAMMHAAAMSRLGTTDEAAGWREVRCWMDRLDRLEDPGFFVSAKPAAAPQDV